MATVPLLCLLVAVAVKKFVELVTNGRLLECHALLSLFDPHHCAHMVTPIEVLNGVTDYDVL